MIRRDYKIRLTREEEADLVARMRAGDVAAKQALVESCVPWMRKLARRACADQQQLDDLTQVAIVALIECLEDFDPGRARLTTYAVRPAIWRMRREMNAAGSVVSRSQNKNRKFARAWETAAHVGELPAGLLARYHDPAHDALLRDDLAQLAAVLRRLPPRLADILTRRAAGQTLQSIGSDLGVTRERIRQLEKRALTRVRKLMGANELCEQRTPRRPRA